jgi:hypothetical protein
VSGKPRQSPESLRLIAENCLAMASRYQPSSAIRVLSPSDAENAAILEKRDELHDTFRRAMLDLLRNGVPIYMPVSQYMRDKMADELEQLWWPDPKAVKRRRRLLDAEVRRTMLEFAEAHNRQNGVERPRSAAKEEMARFFGYSSGEALRKDLQPHRVNRRPRRKPRS